MQYIIISRFQFIFHYVLFNLLIYKIILLWNFFIVHGMEKNKKITLFQCFLQSIWRKNNFFQHFKDFVVTRVLFLKKQFKEAQTRISCDLQISTSCLESYQDIVFLHFDWMGDQPKPHVKFWCVQESISLRRWSLHQWFLWYPFLKLAAENYIHFIA